MENSTKKLAELILSWKHENDFKEAEVEGFWSQEMYESMMELIETFFKSKMLPVEYVMMMSYMSSVQAVMEDRDQQQQILK